MKRTQQDKRVGRPHGRGSRSMSTEREPDERVAKRLRVEERPCRPACPPESAQLGAAHKAPYAPRLSCRAMPGPHAKPSRPKHNRE